MKKRDKTNLMLKLSRLLHIVSSYVNLLGLGDDQSISFKSLVTKEIGLIKEYLEKVPAEAPAPQHIYTITTVNYSGTRKRFPGFTFSFDEAEEIVKENINDINENLYVFAVIEKTFPGLYTFDSREEHWYKFSALFDKYEPIEKPEKFKHVVCWGIG